MFYVANENNKLPLLDETDDSLAAFYNNLLRFVEKDCRIIMDVTAKIGARNGKKHMPAPEIVEDNLLDGPDEGEHLAASTHFEIMANVIWAEIGQALMEELGSVIFSAGRPAEFKKVGYSSTNGFTAEMCTSSTIQPHEHSSQRLNFSLLTCVVSSPCEVIPLIFHSSGDGNYLCTSSCGGRKLLANWRIP